MDYEVLSLTFIGEFGSCFIGAGLIIAVLVQVYIYKKKQREKYETRIVDSYGKWYRKVIRGLRDWH